MSRIGLRTDEEANKELIQQTAKEVTESLKKTLEESGINAGKSKVSQILANAGKQPTNDEIEKEKQKIEEIKKQERMEFDKEKERLHKELEESEVDCPLCSKGEHKHRLKRSDKGTLVCTGDGCKTEYSLIPNNADYYCASCKTPHLRPKTHEEQEKDACPFCNGNEFIKADGKIGEIDYKKIRERVAKKRS